MSRLFEEMGLWRSLLVMALLFQALIAETIALPIPQAYADPAYCYSTGQWIQFPDYSGYCLDGEAPFYGPAPSYGGGNHRWPDGSDD